MRGKHRRWIAFSIWFGVCCAGAVADSEPPELVALTSAIGSFQPVFQQQPIPAELLERMRHSTWHQGCPVPLDDIRLLSLAYWDFHGVAHQGRLLVNQAVADDVVGLFRKLFEHGFLIERMEPVEEYGGVDERSMEANNTSAFNCRDVTGKPGKFSNHSWGRAIDVNPLTNPMVLHGKPLPPQGAQYLDRHQAVPGAILSGGFIVKIFEGHGWTWGGDWDNPDYQHFEKPEAQRN